MKNRIRNLLGFFLAYVLGLTYARPDTISEDQESATSEGIYNPYIRDSEKDKQKEGEQEVHKYHVYSKEHLQELKKIFPPKRWDKDTDEADLAFSAGQQSVIDNIERRLSREGRKAHVLN